MCEVDAKSGDSAPRWRWRDAGLLWWGVLVCLAAAAMVRASGEPAGVFLFDRGRGAWGPAAGMLTAAGGTPPRASWRVAGAAGGGRLLVHVDFPAFSWRVSEGGGRLWLKLDADGCVPGSAVGAPQLPVVRMVVNVPAGFSLSWNLECMDGVGNVALDTFSPSLAGVFPRQPPRRKRDGAAAFRAASFVVDEERYADGAAAPGPQRVSVVHAGRARGREVYVVEVRPVLYRPASGVLVPAASLDLSLVAGAKDGRTALPRTGFPPVASLPVVGAGAALDGGKALSALVPPPRLLIVYNPVFSAGVEELAAFKRSLGFEVEAVSTAVSGSSREQIRDYIRDRYGSDETRPDFVLLVGDTVYVPAWVTTSPYNPYSDLYYGCMDDGDDWLPEIPVGRYSVANAAEFDRLLDKQRRYESGLAGEWVKKAAFMASDDHYAVSEGTHDYVISQWLDPRGFACDRLYVHSYGATTSQVSAAIEDGRGLLVYSGHGIATAWVDGPVFQEADVRALANEVPPLVFSFACLTGAFGESECLMETWIRNSGGAALSFGSSVYTYWDEDDFLEKALFASFFDEGEYYVGRAVVRAKERFLASYGASEGQLTRSYFEQYNLFGDPSLFMRVELGPDLDAREVGFSPSSGAASDTCTLSVEVRNVGGEGSGGPFYVSFLFSSDAAVTTSDTEVGRVRVPALDSGGAVLVSTSVRVPDLPPGCWYVGVAVDPLDEVEEYREANNTAVSSSTFELLESVEGVNLHGVSLEVQPSAPAPAGTTLTLSSTWYNQGTSASGDFVITCYLSTDSEIGTTSDLLLAVTTCASIDSHSYLTTSIEARIPSTVVPGEYFVGCVAEAADDFDESDDSLSAPYRIGTPPAVNLVAVDVRGPAVLVAGRYANLTHQVHNEGEEESGPFSVSYYLSPDGTTSSAVCWIATVTDPSLAGGGSGTFTDRVLVPADAPVGEWSLGVFVDSTSAVEEVREDDNLCVSGSPVTVTTPSSADLHPVLTAMPSAAAAGGVLPVSWRVENEGDEDVPGGFTVAFLLSSDGTYDTSDVMIGSRLERAYLAGGAVVTRSAELQVPSTMAPGAYRLILVCDSEGEVPESDEADNVVVSTSTVSVSPPAGSADLVPSYVQFPSWAVGRGAPFIVECALSNGGSADVAEPFDAAVYLSADGLTVDTSPLYRLGVSRRLGLTRGGVDRFELVVSADSALPTGTYHVALIADSSSEITEAYEDNNTWISPGTLTITAAPAGADLVPLSLNGPASSNPGGSFTVACTWANHGQSAVSGGYTVEVFLSEDGAAPSTTLAAVAAGALASLATTSASAAVTLPPDLAPGVYHLGFTVDSTSAVAEEVETNNTFVADWTLQVEAVSEPPDLTVTSVLADRWAVTGDYLGVSRRVRNVGQSSTPATWTVAYHLSTDTVLDASDLPLGTESPGVIDGGGEDYRSVHFVVPSSCTPGDYYVIVTVDAGGDVSEGREDNNTAVSLDVVSIAGAPNLGISLGDPVPASVSVGMSVNVPRTVVNTGHAATSDPVRVRYYLSWDDSLDLEPGSMDRVLATETLPGGLAAGASDAGSFVLTIPADVSVGTWHIGAVVDPCGEVGEEDETDNESAEPLPSLTIAGAPDLVAGAVTFYTTGVQGAPIDVSVAVENASNTSSPSFAVRCRLSEDASYDTTDVLLGDIQVEGIAPRSRIVTSSTFNLPAVTGAWYVVVWVDPEGGGGVYETDETSASNGASSASTFEVSLPDTVPPSCDFAFFRDGTRLVSPYVGAGDLSVVVVFDEPLSVVSHPLLTIDQQGTDDVTASPMTMSATSSRWTYHYVVQRDDGYCHRDGACTFSLAGVFDEAGNAPPTPPATTLVFDTVAPRVAVTSPAYDYPSRLCSAVVTVTGSIEDTSPVSGEWRLVGWTDPSPLAVDASGGFSIPLTLSSTVARYELQVRAWDAAGNVSYVCQAYLAVDSDGDGMSDYFENMWGLDPANASDASGDPDGDGLTNLEEYRCGTDPTTPDTGVPSADAGGDTTTPVGLARLDGSGSRRADGGSSPLVWNWSYVEGPVAYVSLEPSASASSPFFWAERVGAYRFMLRVRDPDTGTWSVPSYVTVTAVNSPPWPTAAPCSQVVTVPGAFVLDGSSSPDPEGEGAASWSWSEDPANPAGPVLSGTAASVVGGVLSAVGVYRFGLAVSDGRGAVSTDPQAALVVGVDAGNSPPVADGVQRVRRVATGATVELDGRPSLDPEGGALAWSWVLAEAPPGGAGALGGASSSVAALTCPTAGAYRVELVVRDGGGSGLRSTTWTMWVAADAPGGEAVPVAAAGRDFAAACREVVRLDGSASSDPDGDPLAYSWRQVSGPAVPLHFSTGPRPVFGALVPADYTFELRVHDGICWSVPDRVTVHVAPVEDSPPSIRATLSSTSDPDGDGVVEGWTPGTPVLLDATATTDPDGDGLSWYWYQEHGPWSVLDDPTSPLCSFVPRCAGRYGFRVEVSDSKLTTSARVEFVVAEAGDTPPIASAVVRGASGWTPGGVVTLDATGSVDPDGASIAGWYWEQIDGPTGILEDATSAVATFRPSSAGRCTFRLRVWDGSSWSAPLELAVDVGTSGSGGGGGGGCCLLPVSRRRGRCDILAMCGWLFSVVILPMGVFLLASAVGVAGRKEKGRDGAKTSW